MTKTIKLVILEMVVLILTPIISAYADETVESELLELYGSEEFISIATGYKQLVSKAPAVASVIGSEQIQKMGALDLDDVLKTVPGLHVSYNYQAYSPIYTFRGIYSSFNPQVLILFDGVPQTNLFTGGKNLVWAGMPVEAIDRIEIIRGPGSAIYGADAFAGVINVITKGGSGSGENNLGVTYGNYDSKSIFGNFAHQWEESSLVLALQANKTDGHDEIIVADTQSFLDLLTGTTASLAPGSPSLSKEMIDLNLDYRTGSLIVKSGYQGRRDVGNGAGVAQSLDPTSRYASDRYQLSVEYMIEDLLDDLSINLSGSYLDFTQQVEKDSILFPAGSTGPFLDGSGQPLFGIFPDGVIASPEVYERHTRVNSTFHYTGVEKHDLTFGLGYYYGDLYKVREEKNYCTDAQSCAYILPFGGVVDVSDTPFVFLQEGARENHYLYIQDVYSIANDWQLTAGVRYDDYSDFGETVNPRFALVWSTTKDLTTKFLYGEAFRAPSFSETRNINNPAALGNPDLKPETLKSYEIVFDYKLNYDVDLIFNTFYYEWEDLIQFVSEVDGGAATAQNIGRQTGHGVEIETKWAVTPDFNLSANFAWQDSTNKKARSEAANAPEKKFYMQAHWEFATDTSLNLQLNWVMDRNREVMDLRPDIDDYALFDLTLRQKNIWEKVEAALIVKNLFDEDAREPTPNAFPVPGIPYDLPLSGRSVVGEIRYKF